MWPFDYFKKKPNSFVPDIKDIQDQSNANNNHEGIPGITSDSELATKVKSFFIGIVAEPCKIIYHGFATGCYAAVNVFAPSKKRKEAENNHLKGFKDSLLLTCTFGISSLFKEKSDTVVAAPDTNQTPSNTSTVNSETNKTPINQAVEKQAQEAGKSLTRIISSNTNNETQAPNLLSTVKHYIIGKQSSRSSKH